MNLFINFEITGQLSGRPISELAIQPAQDLVLGLQKDIGLIVLANNPNSTDQYAAHKAVEIMLDDMEFNLGSQIKNDSIKQTIASGCLHESIDNINDYFIDHDQLSTEEQSTKGVSLTTIQIHDKGISCCMHGGLAHYKFSNESFDLIGNKASMAKSLGINPALSFTIDEQSLAVNDILFLAHHDLVEQLGHEFIRMTLSRFGDNLYMAIRQINARAAKTQTSQNSSFLLCRKISEKKINKGWF